MLLKYISLPTFLISFAIGLFLVYILGDDQKTVFVYPTPDTVDSVLFRDATDGCFQFQSVPTECPSDKSQIEQVPVQSI